MVPANTLDPLNPSTNQLYALPKLRDDGSNWITCKERIMTMLASKRLVRHIDGTARKPKPIHHIRIPITTAGASGEATEETEGDVMTAKAVRTVTRLVESLDSITEATEDQLEKADKAIEDYIQNEAMTCQILYTCISDRRLLEVKSLITAADVWKKLCALHEDKPHKRRYLQNM